MKFFNLTKKDNILNNYINYGKVRGLFAAFSYSLPVSKTGWVCSSPNDSIEKISEMHNDYRMLCRPDAPDGQSSKLPRGKDLSIGEIRSYCREVQSVIPEAIILAFPHPSVDISGRYIPRYEVSGGVMVMVEKFQFIAIDYVGQGFDVGEITRGNNIHTSIVIPGESMHEMLAVPAEEWPNRHDFSLQNISPKEYEASRKSRIKELSGYLEKSTKVAYEKVIPYHAPTFSLSILNQINSLIKPVIMSKSMKVGETFGIMINLYEENPYVFEIYSPTRSSNDIIRYNT